MSSERWVPPAACGVEAAGYPVPMNSAFPLLLAAAMVLPASAGVRSGKAEASWLVAASHYQAGKPLQTAIRLAADDGWHTYWDNPGEGGMATTIELKLPDGWKAGPVGKPVPVRFRTGELPGFGYEGEVLFPVELTPPAGASAALSARAVLSWLACSDGACVPGEAELELNVPQGPPNPTADAPRIAAAVRRVPVPAHDFRFEVARDGDSLLLSLRGTRRDFDPATCEAFPLEAGVVDAGTRIRFTQLEDGHWSSKVPPSE